MAPPLPSTLAIHVFLPPQFPYSRSLHAFAHLIHSHNAPPRPLTSPPQVAAAAAAAAEAKEVFQEQENPLYNRVRSIDGSTGGEEKGTSAEGHRSTSGTEDDSNPIARNNRDVNRQPMSRVSSRGKKKKKTVRRKRFSVTPSHAQAAPSTKEVEMASKMGANFDWDL